MYEFPYSPNFEDPPTPPPSRSHLISNAIELFDVRPRHLGFLPHTIRCLLPNLGPIVGYAVTSRTRASRPELTEAKVDLLGDYLRYVASVPGPKIAVGWDLDEPAGLGAQFGEVTATIHKLSLRHGGRCRDRTYDRQLRPTSAWPTALALPPCRNSNPEWPRHRSQYQLWRVGL